MRKWCKFASLMFLAIGLFLIVTATLEAVYGGMSVRMSGHGIMGMLDILMSIYFWKEGRENDEE